MSESFDLSNHDQDGTCARERREVPIAIIGIGCRFPGGAYDPASFWRLLRDEVDAIGEVPPDRWHLSAFYDPDPAMPGKIYTRWGGFVEPIDRFDAPFFGISPREASVMDPQQRLLLEVTWEALEDAGLVVERLAGSAIGVFVGISSHDFAALQSQPSERRAKNPYKALGSTSCVAANRISYAFDWRGPSLAVDTACSSSLVALHLACQSVSRGESTLALVGGVNLLLKPETTISFCDASMMSPDGRCKSFDARANGYVRAEGAGAIILKPLARALRDGDRVYAVVRGTAANQDGHTGGIAVPNGAAQEAMLREACRRAGVDPAGVQYAEAHGTGTAVGDPIEANALGAVLGAGRRPGDDCLIGSVKSNIGHLEAGAGIAGVIKTALALHHGRIPPTLHFRQPNPAIDFERLRLRVCSELEPWPGEGGRPRLAVVSSFGFGGSNASAVLADAPAAPVAAADDMPGKMQLVPLSARAPDALGALARATHDWLKSGPGSRAEVTLADVAYTAGARRSHHPHRLAVLARNKEELAESFGAWVRGESLPNVFAGRAAGKPALVFVFTGMGPQWWGMGRRLLALEPKFRQALEECDGLLRSLAGWSLLEEMQAPEDRSRIHEACVAQPAIMALQVGLVALWRSWGVEPTAVIGHSVGEAAAAYAAGALTLPDAVRVIHHRSRLQQRTRGQGQMLAVGISAEHAEQHLAQHPGRVALAAINGPQAVTLSGEAATLAMIRLALEPQGTFCRFLAVDVPYHSPMMEPLREDLIDSLAALAPLRPRVPLYSTVTGAAVNGEPLDARYWWRNVREPVRFAAAIMSLLEAGNTTYLEIGPHPVLSASISACAAQVGKEAVVLSSLRRKEDESTTMRAALCHLYTNGHAVAWTGLNAAGGRLLTLPAYPWQRERCWQESEESQQVRLGLSGAGVNGLLGRSVHPLLGRPVQSAHADPAWHVDLDLQLDHAWLSDHRVQGTIICPASAYVELALAAGNQNLAEETCVPEGLEFHRALYLPANETRKLQLILDTVQKTFEICSQESDGSWTRHATGTLRGTTSAAAPAMFDLDRIRSSCAQGLSAAEHYQFYRGIGMEFGPRFQGVEEILIGQDQALGRIRVPEGLEASLAGHQLHPALLDACFQVIGWTTASELIEARRRNDLYLPRQIDRVIVRRPWDLMRADGAERPYLWSYARLVNKTDVMLKGDLLILDREGNVLTEIIGLQCRAVTNHRAAGLRLENQLFTYNWRLALRPGEAVSDVLGGDTPAPSQLATIVRPAALRCREELERPRYYRDVRPALDRLCLAYFLRAFRRLGGDRRFNRGLSAEAIADQLGVVHRYRRLFKRILSILHDRGIVRPCDDEWQVFESAELQGPGSRWKSVLDVHSGYQAELMLLAKTGPRLADVLRGDIDPTRLLFGDGPSTYLEHLYHAAPWSRFCNMIIQEATKALVQRWPGERPLRILEIGGGTGGLTAYMLSAFPARRTEYYFSALSPEMVAQAEGRFRDHAFVRYRTLDIDKEPIEQGWEAHSFDLIVAADVLQATAVARALKNVRRLLAPDGLFLLAEPTRDDLIRLLLFELMSAGASEGASENRLGLGVLSRGQWTESLAQAGFTDINSVDDATGEEEAHQTVFLATAPPLERTGSRLSAAGSGSEPGCWLILADAQGIGRELALRLRERGEDVLLVRPREVFAQEDANQYRICPQRPEDMHRLLEADCLGRRPCRGILHLWGLDTPAGEETTPASLAATEVLGCLSATYLVQACAEKPWSVAPRLYLVTRGVHAVGSSVVASPAQAPLWGLGRVVMNEQPQLRCTLVDLSSTPTAEELDALSEELLDDHREDEVALRGRARYVHRLAANSWEEIREGARRGGAPPDQPASAAAGPPFRLEIATPGMLEQLAFRRLAREAPPPGCVEIEVHATSLNFKDLMVAMGMLPEEALSVGYTGRLLGLECAGTVVAVGEGVTDLAVGDEVLGSAPGTLGSHVIADARLVARKPPRLSFEEAATIPNAFGTAYYCLHHLARVRPGERVLVHAAAGGVGLAAVQIAQAAGAEVFATAGADEKRELLKLHGINHIFSSRSLNFVREVLDCTGGRGVNVVLNSLAGEFIPASLELLRPGGRFLEIGKRDIYANSKLGLRPFNKNISYFGVDIDRLMREDPDLCSDLLRRINREFLEGRLHPLPHRVFPLDQVADAFRHMMKARHTGKIVLPVRGERVALAPDDDDTTHFEGDATYLITGGVGGFGLATAAWMVQHGARHLVLVGRGGASSEEARLAVGALEQAGAHVVVARADVTVEGQVAAVLARIRSSLPPLRGVIHAAMVLDDAILPQLDAARLHRVMAPKVLGAWNLHRLTSEDSLDFFILFSSAAAIVGNRGQGNYVAANAFLDSLAHYRRGRGLPALTVNWTAVEDVGYVAQHAQVREHLDRLGLTALPTKHLLKALGSLIRHDAVQVAVMQLDAARWAQRDPAARSPRFAEVVGAATDATATGDGAPQANSLHDQLLAADVSTRRELVESGLREQVSKVLGMSAAKLDRQQSLTDMGLDSLMAVELGIRLRKDLGVEMSTMKLMRGDNLGDLAGEILAQMIPADPGSNGMAEPADPERAVSERSSPPAAPGSHPAARSAPIGTPAEGHVFAWTKEWILAPDIRPPVGPTLPATEPSAVLLTGATGFLGAFLLRDLLRETAARVFCLVRCRDAAEGAARIRRNLEVYLLWDESFADRIVAVPGDLAEPALGLTEAAYQALATEIGVIYHNGACVNLLQSYRALRPANVWGTVDILRLACSEQLKPVHFVSSLGVFDRTPVHGPAAFNELDLPHDLETLKYDYERSKAVAEFLVREAQARGIPVVIYRPGLVSAASTTGASTTRDFAARLLKSWIDLGAAPDDDRELVLTPVDYVSRAIVYLSMRPDSPGETFHLTNPRPVPMRQLRDMIRSAGYSSEDASSGLPPSPAASGGDGAGDAVPLWPPPNVRFDCERTLARLAGSGIVCPPVDSELVKSCLDYFARMGFVASRAARPAQGTVKD